MPGDMRVNEAFVVTDVDTAKVVFRELDPAPDAPWTASGTVRFALPADKTVVAVGYGFPRSNQPVTLFDTRDWRKLATIAVPAEGPTGVGKMVLSNDHSKLAYSSSKGLVVVDIRTGSVITRLPVEAADFAFNAEGQLLAVVETVPTADGNGSAFSELRVYRLPDGANVASLSTSGSLCYDSLHWDPRGRFLAFTRAFDRVCNTVHFWNPATGKSDGATIQLRSVSRSLSISPDGKRLAVGDGNAIDVFKIGD
jgi:WD40 repeat protein